MTKNNVVTARTSVELARVLGLSDSYGYEWELQAKLLTKLKDIVSKNKLTHLEIAKKTGTSRTRITSILNGNLKHVSSDMLVRILGSLGYQVNVSVVRTKLAA